MTAANPSPRLTAGRVFMTFAILIYGAIPPLVDLNRTHPDWTPHARMHLAWLVITNSSLSLVALGLLWRRPGTAPRPSAWLPS